MRNFLGIVGLISMLISGITLIMGIGIYNEAETIMQQAVGMDFVIYSGILLIASITGIGFSFEK